VGVVVQIRDPIYKDEARPSRCEAGSLARDFDPDEVRPPPELDRDGAVWPFLYVAHGVGHEFSH
jgi:hypothetical protein